MAFATVPRLNWQVEAGGDHLATVRTSKSGERHFCAKCGSSLSMQVDDYPDEIDVAICTLDDPGKLPPEFHIFTASKVGWFETADTLPRHSGARENETDPARSEY